MGSASRSALEASKTVLASMPVRSERVGEEVLAAARTIASSAQLRSLLADPGISPEDKGGLVGRVFAKLDRTAVALLAAMAAERWSTQDEFVAGIEEIGIRALVASAGPETNVQSELFAFENAVRSDSALELAVSSKLGSPEAKSTLVERLLGGASPQTRVLVSHLVRQPRGRRIGESLRNAAAVAADQAGLGIAVVRTATPLTLAQLTRLQDVLSRRYGRKLSVNQVVDETLVGGLRISIGDDVIDGSVATRLSDLRLQLVG
ncbi:F0F1 ATP synthase subunit delta [Naasia sp. SYSU D00948]|uniref:F0F1 ATP synthase subunit delta n=1 Tax=Naasia sp. SYSU D00948 TaxID=2817379 RepID=UPI001B30EC1E|nr:F0F1 ATP synthase subunit delta [Naasia sp. SYSU D00948]